MENSLGKSLRLQLSFSSVLQMFLVVTAAFIEKVLLTLKQKKQDGYEGGESMGEIKHGTFLTQMVPRCLQLFHHLFLVIHYASSSGFSQMLCID